MKKKQNPIGWARFIFQRITGLYVIVSYESDTERMLAEDLLEALAYTGIGGKKSVGLVNLNY